MIAKTIVHNASCTDERRLGVHNGAKRCLTWAHLGVLHTMTNELPALQCNPKKFFILGNPALVSVPILVQGFRSW